MIITDSATLATFCAGLRGAPYIAVDTEFLRERTYYAQLCLVQVAYGPHAAAIDPLAPGLDLAPLRDLLLDASIVKVFHAATQDLEIFFQKTGAVPAPVFDTQIAAAACDKGDQPGYATLVHTLLGVDLDKASQATDWSVRPLTERQITYALADVTHLCRLYELLVAELDDRGRAGWVAQDMNALLDPSRYQVDPREAYRRLRVRGAKRQTLAVLRELAAWREETAMHRDLPRPWVVHDDALVEIAQHLPADLDELARVRTLKPQVARGADGKALLSVMRKALELPESEWPVVPDRRAPLEGHEPLVALLQALLRVRCEAHGVAPRMVASREDLDQLATAEVPDVECLNGWRRELFGADALELRAGRLALTGRDGTVVVVRVGEG
ncbi:MAG: ribonuclease D [Pseudomonadota bacterium]|nr:ribonuclease D [Pseudomonadota bacterium]